MTVLGVLLTRDAAAQLAGGPPEPPEATGASAMVPTATGSLTPDVVYEDLAYTLRDRSFRSVSISPHQPGVAYVTSYDGYVWRTVDGGKTWEESRLIVDARPFFGDSGQRMYFGSHRRSAPAWDPLHADTGSPGELLRGSAIGSRYGLMSMRLEPIRGGGVGRSAAAANVNFGAGLPGGAPRLQLLVRKLGKPTSGINLKQVLVQRGSRPTEVRFVVVHPRQPKVLFACTLFGLYKSYNGGLSWVRIFLGDTPGSRRALHLAVDPSDPRRVFLATGDGVYESSDGGESFQRSTRQGVGGGRVNWLYFNPHDPRYLFAGTDVGLLCSADSGRTWNWIYFTTYPPARVVRSVVIDPADKRSGYIATHDGLFATSDLLTGGLEGWRRLGGLAFTGNELTRIVVCRRHKGHLWTLTNTGIPSVTNADNMDTGGAFVWETVDGGETWKVIYSGFTGGSITWFDADPHDPDLLWITWSNAVHRMVRRPVGQTAAELSAERKRRVQDLLDGKTLPTVSEVMLAARRYTGTDVGPLLAYRARARLKPFVPRLDAAYSVGRLRDYPVLASALYPVLPFFRRETLSGTYSELRLMLTWDLSDVVFNLHGSLFGRAERIRDEIGSQVLVTVTRLYGELRRLHLRMAAAPPEELRVRLLWRLRIEELESYLDFATGGYLARFRRGDQPSGLDTKFFTRWE